MKDNIFDKIQYLYWSIVPHDYRPDELWYKLKCWVWHRYTTVKPRYLPHTWMDRDKQLVHSMFEILSEFIEKECDPGNVNGEEKYVRDEMQELYNWWHKDYIPNIWESKLSDKLNEAIKYPKITSTPCEDNKHLSKMNFVYDNDEHEEKTTQQLKELNHLEAAYDDKLSELMHRLIEVKDYMWT